VNNNESLKAINPDAARIDLGVGGTAFAGRAAGQVLIGGGVSDFSGGIGGSPTYFYHWNSLQLYDDAFLVKGTHSIRFGGAFERMLLNVVADTDPNGIWRFADLNGFSHQQSHEVPGWNRQHPLAAQPAAEHLRFVSAGRLALEAELDANLGLRYEMATVPSETNGKIANLSKPVGPVTGVWHA